MVETIISVHRNTVSVDVFVRETLTNSQNFRLRRAGVPWVGVPWGFQNPQKRGRGPPEHKRECGRPNAITGLFRIDTPRSLVTGRSVSGDQNFTIVTARTFQRIL